MRDPPRILIVDDNENNRAIIAARLGAQVYSTFEAWRARMRWKQFAASRST